MYGRLPLFEALKNVARSNFISMHMPGHKRNDLLGTQLSRFFHSKVAEFDFTEIPGLDDLHAPGGVIEEAQKLAAKCFGARRTFFLVNGSSAGIHGAVMACCREGDKIAVPRNAHRSVYEGLILSGARPVYYRPCFNKRLAVAMGPDNEQVKDLLERGSLKALVLIHPTYHGVAADLDLIEEAQRREITVIVDEAHGSHFKFDARLPLSSLEAGGDIVVHGTHKTLGSLTQTGLLHLGTGKVGAGEIQKFLSLLQTTSPSYVLMASLDAMRCDMEAMGRELVSNTVDMALVLRREINKIPGFSCIEFKGFEYDTTKLLLTFEHLDGYGLGDVLRNYYGIYPELESKNFVLLMVTVGDTEETISNVVRALKDFSRKYNRCKSYLSSPMEFNIDIYDELPEMELTPREAFMCKTRRLPLLESCGKICGSMVVPYPPGVPVILPGERISKTVVEYLSLIKRRGYHVQGLGNGGEPEIEVLEC